MISSQYLNLLRNHIDITRVPFSDRGSRLLIYREKDDSSLFIKLAERLTAIEPGLDAYRLRPPFISDLIFTDEHGKKLEFEVTSFPHKLSFTTQLGEIGLVFQDRNTVSIGLPQQKTIGIKFHVAPQFWKETEQGGHFKFIRNLAYTSNGESLVNRITPEDGGYSVHYLVKAGNDCAFAISIAGNSDLNHDVKPFSMSSTASEQRWLNWYEKVPPVLEEYQSKYAYAWWIMANNLISPRGVVAYEAMTPSKINYIGLWLWDSAMHALAFRHVDCNLARNQIRAMIAHQLDDGMIPDAVYDEGVIAEIEIPFRAEVTKPPILAWAALKLHETDPDEEFLKEIYVPLVRWNAWWFSMNDDDVDGIAQYNHPYSSGLDDNPLWDYGMPVESPDLNTYLCVQMGSLAMIAEILGMDAEAEMWRRRTTAIVHRMIEHFWDEEAGLFWAMHENETIRVVTPFNLYPLWTGQLPDHIRDRLISHLTNPDMFWGDFQLPSVAYNDPHFDPVTMWRGPVWVNINYFFIEALKQIDQFELADQLLKKTLHMMMEHPSIYEYYNAMTGEPPPTAADIFGWSAAVFIDLAIQASQEAENERTRERKKRKDR